MIVIKRMGLLILVIASASLSPWLHASVQKGSELEYGVILFDYYQQDYFSALIEYEYNKSIGNPLAVEDSAKVLKGGMMLSYGLTDYSHKIFDKLLTEDIDEQTRNRAWFYLASLYFNKGNIAKSSEALLKIKGDMPREIHQRYHYLATLINIRNKHLSVAKEVIFGGQQSSPYEPYLLFNLAMSQLKSGKIEQAIENLQRVTSYADNGEEFSALADRAKHAQALIAMEAKKMPQAWVHLQGIGTSGLYSNRALLTYAWTAINLQRFDEAIPALRILDKRSIALPEVQETKVLLPHLYEQQGAKRKALKGYLLAVKEFERGVSEVEEARRIIAKRDVPEEFVVNLEAIMDDSDWFGTQPTVDYNKLTPFLVELMASNAFQESLKELADLYAIRKNLNYWQAQSSQHKTILANRGSKLSPSRIEKRIADGENSFAEYNDEILELRLHVQTLEMDDQKRFGALLDTSEQELDLLGDKIVNIKKISKPYRHSKGKKTQVKTLHRRIDQELKKSNNLIATIEPVMRAVVNAELDKHEERMRYYWAQARLAKARLYDSTLLGLDDVKPAPRNNSERQVRGSTK